MPATGDDHTAVFLTKSELVRPLSVITLSSFDTDNRILQRSPSSPVSASSGSLPMRSNSLRPDAESS